MKKRTKRRFIILSVILLILVVVSIAGTAICPNDPNLTNPKVAMEGPSKDYPFGTDVFGRCVLSRTISGGKISIFTSLALVILSAIIGTFVGTVSGYFGGRVDNVLMRINDVFLAFPFLVLAIVVAGLLGGGLMNAAIALVFTGWTAYSRLVRSQVMQIKQEGYITAAKLSGDSHGRIILIHILPNVLGLIIVTATLQISSMIMGLAGLSFLGLGAQVPVAEWGSMISDGMKTLQSAPWAVLLPGLVMISVIILFNLFGDTLRDVISQD